MARADPDRPGENPPSRRGPHPPTVVAMVNASAKNWVWIAAWPVLDDDRPLSSLVQEAIPLIEAMTADRGVLLLEHPRYELRDDVRWEDVPEGTTLLVATARAVTVTAAAAAISETGTGPARDHDTPACRQVDEVVVERRLTGERIRLSRAEREEAGRRLVARGTTRTALSRQLRMNGTEAAKLHDRVAS